MSATTCTSSPIFVNVTVPVTLLPDFDSSVATALVTSCACAKAVRAHNIPRQIIILFMSKRYGASEKMKRSIEQTLLDPRVSIDAPIAQEWPMRPMFVYAVPVDFGHDNFFAINRTFR